MDGFAHLSSSDYHQLLKPDSPINCETKQSDGPPLIGNHDVGIKKKKRSWHHGDVEEMRAKSKINMVLIIKYHEEQK